jgi:sortase A
VKPGDVVLVELPGRRPRRLTVEATSVVDSRTAVIRSEDRAGLILITCYPFDAVVPGGPLRYVVTARAGGG